MVVMMTACFGGARLRRSVWQRREVLDGEDFVAHVLQIIERNIARVISDQQQRIAAHKRHGRDQRAFIQLNLEKRRTA